MTDRKPMSPVAPARVSTKNCCLKVAASWSATMRASTSAVPPGANVLTMRTGFAGHDWANAGDAAASSAKTAAIQRAIGEILFLDQPCLLDHRAPERGLAVDQRLELLRRHRLGHHALLAHALLYLGLGHGVGDLAIDLAHDLVGQAGRSREREPGVGAELRIAEL